MQIKKSKTSIDNTNNLKLSIQFSLDGFSFCISDIDTNNDVFFTEYVFDTRLKTPSYLLESITSIFKNDKNLQLDFKKVVVIHQNNLNTVVPKEYFNEKLLKDYLDFNIKTLKTDFVAFDALTNTDANNVFVPYVNINNYLFQHFGEFEYKHHMSVFIDKLIPKNKEDKVKNMFVNVSRNTFDLVVLEGNKLILSNIFSYKTKEDFLYYILFVAEQLSLNTEVFELNFSGNIKEEEDLFKICYKYIKNISFFSSTNEIFNHIEGNNHSHFTLLH